MNRSYKYSSRLAGMTLFLMLAAATGNAQGSRPLEQESSAGMWPFVIIAIVLASLGVVYYFWKQSKQSLESSESKTAGRSSDYDDKENFDDSDVDVNKELEWLRKAKSKTHIRSNAERSYQGSRKSAAARAESPAVTAAFQEKMKMLQYSQLPINSFGDLMPPKHFEPLQESHAKALLDAIDQANPDLEDDESVRDVSIKVLAAFRTWNSVEALSQIALYDISASLRAKAVTVLADFDHESVFEPILLACADPTREVRAAAARGLFRLNFDRSGAWRRLIETHDDYRMKQAVRAAVESGIATKSFERLIHEDLKVAYEAFTLVALMIKAGETNEIFDTIRHNKDERVKLALLHVLKVIKDDRAINGITELSKTTSFSPKVVEKIQDTLRSNSATAKSAV